MSSKCEPASLAFALIAKNAAANLGACLNSIRPIARQIVVCVDETTEDNTAEVARDHGADLVTPIAVSSWHECPEHGRVSAQHFARARNESFTYLDPALRWWGWIDSDDVLEGGERLAERLNAVTEEPVGYWLPYHYATVERDGKHEPTTVFHRERILRSDLAWKWEGRVHETVACGLNGPWVGMDDVIIRHQAHAHKSESSALRNLLLLEIDLEENYQDQRAMFYMGNQYFAMSQWEAAAEWYGRLAASGASNPYELWQAYCYQALAFLKLEDAAAAREAAFAAMDVIPEHPEPYFHLASAYAAVGEHEKALFWINQGRARKEPPCFVFKNPLDYRYNNRVLAADVLAGMGHVIEARKELEGAYRVLPDEQVGNAIRRYREMEEAADNASAFVQLARNKPDEEILRLWETAGLAPDVKQFGRCRDLVMPAYMRGRQGSRPHVVFYCGRSLESWAPPTLNETGIGGSETAVIEIARRFVADGWRVDVINNAGRYEGVYEEVGYWDVARLADIPQCDLLVSWRSPGAHTLPLGRRAGVLWCHDLNYGEAVRQDMHLWDRVLGVSEWHGSRLAGYYGLTNTDYVPNGVNLERFEPNVKKVPFRCVYASSPDRGLNLLLEVWPRLVEAEPTAELHVAYGWENYDKGIAAGRADMAAFKERMTRKMEQTPRVVWRGRLPQDELARLYSESYCWLYPATFTEVSCISAMEAMAGGAVAVTSTNGALPSTLGEAGVLVEGHPHSRAWLDFYAYISTAVLMSPDIRWPKMHAGRERAKSLTWDASYQRWKAIAAELLEGAPQKEEAVA